MVCRMIVANVLKQYFKWRQPLSHFRAVKFSTIII